MNLAEEQIQKSFSYRQVGSITHCIETLAYPFSSQWLKERFAEDPSTTGLPIEQDGAIIGVLPRDALTRIPDSSFGNVRESELKRLLGSLPKSIQASDFIENLFDAQLDDESGTIDDFYLVYHQRSFMGVVAFEQLVSHINKLRTMDLKKAKEVQDHLLSLAEQKDSRFKIAIFNRMAGHVGGDFYVNFNYNHDKCRVVGCFDVSGKGLAASLNTTVLGAFFSAFRHFGGDALTPNLITQKLDSFVRELSPEGMFTAAALAYVDFENNKVYFQNCGLSPIYLFVPAAETVSVKIIKPNLPPLGLGSLGDTKQTFIRVDIQKGLRLVMFSDGFTDMRDVNGGMYGEERAHDFLVKSDGGTQEAFIESVTALVDDYQGKSPQVDDITVLDLRF